jgi:hypothetical protein
MEQLLLILFVLFSVITALLERRKRKRALEEATGANPSTAPAADDGEEEDVDGWPFPMGGADPFEPRSRRAEPPQEVALAVDERQAEERADSLQDAAREAAQAAQQIQAKHRIDELVRKRLAVTNATEEARSASRSKQIRWKLSAKEARRAFVYAEIIGLPKSLKDD